jgi:heme/copper-type cytochrome/quinol oxidase subunit 3
MMSKEKAFTHLNENTTREMFWKSFRFDVFVRRKFFTFAVFALVYLQHPTCDSNWKRKMENWKFCLCFTFSLVLKC